MKSTGNVYCRQIIDIIAKHGVETAFCSPGSRNAPLLIALDSHAEIKKKVVVDERSSAFQALGCALVEQKPVLLVCTSGTAVLNYSPAIAEAYYSGVPLIVVSADRPREWIDQDDSQTIRQYGVLSHIVKGSYDIRAIAQGSLREYTDEVKWTVNRTVNEAMLKAIDGKAGPVHINVQLSDPLGDICECEEDAERYVGQIRPMETLPREVFKSLAEDAINSKILLVAGFMKPDNSLDRAVRMFATLPNVAVMAETISNLHDSQPLSSMIDSVLCRMTNEDKERLQPDIVISMGGAIVSRMLKQYLRRFPPRRHWNVGHANYFCDCLQSLTETIDITPSSFLRQMYGIISKMNRKSLRVKFHESDASGIQDNASKYAGEWLEVRKEAKLKSVKYIKESAWSDLTAIDYILNNLELDNLVVSNGTAVRYSQLIPHKCHAEYCNRGVSGIDGSTATAVGIANAYSGHTTLITGDMSWLYDSGASTLINIPDDMRIIVMDNSGGGIFRFIKSTSGLPSDTLERYFCVSNLPDIGAIAGAYGLEVEEASDMEELKDRTEWLNSDSDFPRLLIVRTPADESARILKGYFGE
ncbi:MAG: 2-succinyl-5-enolpyruvyl-6-hydroxy-3-cyclohexene-1-carboxylic-acid synthase [Muribaculum sp.]|nr:2-succinyl-5-enolpyruvyl-6-hydroxy-3-cyclohexene-1-carboxylic-acid synthase [Muribaculum sp.]